MEHPIKMDYLGVPLFSETPISGWFSFQVPMPLVFFDGEETPGRGLVVQKGERKSSGRRYHFWGGGLEDIFGNFHPESLGKGSQIDEHIFQMGWNYQLALGTPSNKWWIRKR